ncbi:MAG: hypothetical protein QM804_15680 [Propionicimonas sp.]
MGQCTYRWSELPAGVVYRCHAQADTLLTFRFTEDGRTQTREFCDEHASDWLAALGMDTLIELHIVETQQQPALLDNVG